MALVAFLIVVTVFRPVRADSVETLQRAPFAVRNVCQPSLGLDGCHVEQALSHNGRLYFLVNGSLHEQPFSLIVETSEEGENPTTIPLGPQAVTSFAIDNRERIAYLVRLGSGLKLEYTIYLSDKAGTQIQSRKVPSVLSPSLRLVAGGAGIVAVAPGSDIMIPLLSDGVFVEATLRSMPTQLGPFVLATRLGQEQLAFVSMMTGATQLYSDNEFVGPVSKIDLQQVTFADIQSNVATMRQPGSKRGALVDIASSPEGSLLLHLSGYSLNQGAVVVETLPLEPAILARVYRLELGASEHLKSSDNPTSQMTPQYTVSTAKTLVLGELTSGIFAVYKR